jgi:DNA repair protein RecN (Recombination protein N)
VLRRLRLEQFVIVEEAEIEFGPALNALTGETGTGKSIVIDAIDFLAGGRGETGWIRAGAGGLAVEGIFDVARLPEATAVAALLGCPAEDGCLRVRRELSTNGRGKASIQGRGVRLADLRALGAQLLAIHGQGEHRRLLEPGVQLELLDRFAEALPLRERYAEARGLWQEAARVEAEGRARLDELIDKEEWHRFQFDEIEAARIAPGEEERLRAARDDRSRIQKSREVGAQLADILFDDEGSALERIETALHRISGLGDGWRELREQLESARDRLRAARHQVPDAASDADEEDLDSIEERLARLARLKKKYGGSEEAILDRRDRLAALLEETERLREGADALAKAVASAAGAAGAAALALRKARRSAAPRLGKAVSTELHALGMAGAVLEFVLEEEEDAGDGTLSLEGRLVRSFPDGCDRGVLRLRPNPGEGAGPLAEVASGGELSRTLLALMAVLGEREEPRTAIFDEVDAGVGGATAAAVARRLAALARDRQVLLVTHLPLVACRAQRHLRVEKSESKGRTNARIVALDHEERIGELARMLAGEGDSEIARKHAEALMEAASAGKEIG